MALLITGVLGDEVEVFAADDESSVHLGGDDGAGKDTTPDRDETGERALLVYRKPLVPFPPSSKCTCGGRPATHLVRSKVAITSLARSAQVHRASSKRTDVVALNRGLGGAES